MVKIYSLTPEHWQHLRTTNIVLSLFATVWLRTDASSRYKPVEGAKAIIWTMLQIAEKLWQKLTTPELLPLVASGVTFTDGRRTRSGTVKGNGNYQSERTAA